MALLVYVDDIIITGSSSEEIGHIKHVLNQQFHLKDVGQLKYYFGLEIAQSTNGIALSQRNYILQLLEDTSILSCNPAHVPMQPKACLSAASGDDLPDITHYRRLIGRLLYLTIFRPYIVFAVHKLSQFVACPKSQHLQAIHHLLCYLKGRTQAKAYSSLLLLHYR